VQERTRQTSAQNMTGGVGQRRVPKQFLETYHLLLPPLAEQHRIVAKIEELFTNLDKGIESLKTAQQQLKVYRQAVLKWAFEGKLSESGLGGLKDDRMKEGRSEKKILKSPNPENPASDKGELPEGWKWVKLKQFCDIRGGATMGRNFKENPNNSSSLFTSGKRTRWIP